MSKGATYADLYFQYGEYESWVLNDNIISSGSYSIDKGVGVRSVYGDKTAFAYSDQISLETLHNATKTNLSIGHLGSSNIIINNIHNPYQHTRDLNTSLYMESNPLLSIESSEKIRILNYINTQGRKHKYIKNIIASISAEYEIVMVARADGKIASDIRPLVHLSITALVDKDGQHEKGSYGGGGRFSYQYFSDEAIDQYIEKAVKMAYTNLEASPAPAGTMPVVLGNGWPGILLHEAVGHGLEGDFNRKGSSAFSDKIGQKVAASGITIVDDGTLANRRGSLNIDDEGNPSQYNILIKDGILQGYIQDEMNARLMGVAVTGNGRRESYADLPMPRMTNTYMLAGNDEPDAIIASVKDGIYATQFEGGQVDITNGKFVFTASQAFEIKNGKIGKALKGATLIGSGPESLKYISMIGNDLQMDNGIGTCGKSGQSVPVGVGQPTLLIDNMTVGGAA
jgi:TldD protein